MALFTKKAARMGRLFLVVVNLNYVYPVALAFAEKVLGEIVGKAPEELFVHIADSMTLAREEEHIEPLVRAD